MLSVRDVAWHNPLMAGPDKQFDQLQTLGAALSVFWKQGFEATSMQDLVEHMGINRASMYQTYGNKHSLFLAALDRYIELSLAELAGMLEQHGTRLDALHALFGTILLRSLQGDMAGCLVNNAAVELGPHDQGIREKVRSFWQQCETLFETQLQAGIQAGELAPHSDTTQLARLLNNSLQGLLVKTKAAVEPTQIREDLTTLFGLIEQATRH